MDEIKIKKYCVIEVLDPPYADFDKYVCVPSSWISFQKTLAGDVTDVKFPIENLSDTKKRVKKSEKCSASWPTFTVNIKCSTDSYQHAQEFIKACKKRLFKKSYAKNDRDEAASSSFSSSNKTTSKSVPNSNIKKTKTLAFSRYVRPAVNQTEFDRESNKNAPKIPTEVSESANSANINKYFTRQVRKTSQSFKTLSQAVSGKSLDQYNEAQESSKEQSNSCIEQISRSNNGESSELIVSPAPVPVFTNEPSSLKRLLDTLKEMHPDFLQCYTIADEIRSLCRENCTLIEQMIELLDKFYNLSSSDALAANIVTCEGTKEKQNETIETEIVKETDIDTPKKQYEQTRDHRTREDEEIYTNISEETMDDNKINVKGTDNKITTASNKIGHQARKFTLPKEYVKNDSRWTLKHQKKKKGLIELLPNSGVYVDAIKLSNCKRISKDSKMLARMLLMEVFSANALSTCSLTGKKANAFYTDRMKIRPGLDENAKNVLLNFVDEYARERKWVKIEDQFICNTLRSKLQEMRAKARKESGRIN